MHNPVTATHDRADGDVLGTPAPRRRSPGPDAVRALAHPRGQVGDRDRRGSARPTAGRRVRPRPLAALGWAGRMFAPRLGHPRRQPSPTATTEPALADPVSHLLEPPTEDLGATWPAHAHRCRQAMAADLAWVAPLIDRDHPQAVCCGHEQAYRMIVWHHHVPTCQHLSLTCRRLTCITGPAGPAGRQTPPPSGRTRRSALYSRRGAGRRAPIVADFCDRNDLCGHADRHQSGAEEHQSG